MAAILAVFGAGVYVFFSRSLYRQLDKKLLTLAQAATPSLTAVKAEGNQYLEQVDEVPWRDIFNRDLQSLEWFDAEGRFLGRRGQLELSARPMTGNQTLRQAQSPNQVRAFTVSVFKDGAGTQEPSLEGYVRASQSTQDIEIAQSQLLWGLGMGGSIALGLSGLGGLWLTQKSLEPIEQSFRQLKQFTADASHELRGPLTAIKASVEVIQNHPERVHPKDAKKLAAIASATTQMSHLAEDLLFLARMDARLAIPQHECRLIALEELLEDLVELLEPSAQLNGVALKFNCAATVSIVGDPAQMTRLFSNLLRNAIQYTPFGGQVTLTLMKRHRYALVRVDDTGIGIAKEHLPFIFDRFWRADKARSRREGGTGLGLAIVKAIVHRHSGKITVTSQIGQGTSFYVRLPVV